MRPLGIHLSYWQTNWSDDVAPLIARAAQAGFDGAELPCLMPATMNRRLLQAALAQHGLRATCGTGLNPALDITSPDSAVRRAGLAHLRACLELAAGLGSSVLGGVTYAPWSHFPNDDLAERRRRCVESLREAGRMAADLGVTLCLEILNRFEGYLLNTVEQGLALLAEVNRPAVKLHLDTFHLNLEEDDVPAAIRRAGPQLGHFHASENNRKPPGLGHLPWAEVKRALDDIGYMGWVVLESFVRPEGEVGRAVSIWQPLVADREAAARAGAVFLRREVAGV